MKRQAGAAQLRLDVKASTFLPGRQKIQDVGVRTQPFVVPGFPHAAVPLTVPPEAMSRTFDSILAAILVALHLKKMVAKSGINSESIHAIKTTAQRNTFFIQLYCEMVAMVKNLIGRSLTK